MVVKRKEREESSPNEASETADDSTSTKPTSKPPAKAAAKKGKKQAGPPKIRKSGRKRVAKRRGSPSPSPPRQRKPATKLPVAHATTTEPPKHNLMSTSRPKSPPLKTSPLLSTEATSSEESSEESEEDTDGSVSTFMSEDPPEYPNARAGVYAPLLRMRQKRHSECIPVIPLPPRVVGGVRDQMERKKVCNCRRSTCLKLYCDCFMAGLCCNDDCKCLECRNTDEFPRERSLAVEVILSRNPQAFRPIRPRTEAGVPMTNIASTSTKYNESAAKAIAQQPGRGCNCRKSNCLKKYCECFLAACYCSRSTCGCMECKNKEGNEEREKLIAERRLKASTTALSSSRVSPIIMAKNEGPLGDVDGTATMANDIRAKTVAGGVDLFLPPSSFTLPMKLQDGMSFPQVAFAKAGSVQGGFPHAPQPGTYGAKTSAKKKAPAKQDQHKYDTDLEKLWRVETDRVSQTFTKVRSDFLESSRPPVSSTRYRTKEQFSGKKKNPMIDYRARMAMDGVVKDMKDIVSAVEKAETTTLKLFDKDAQDENAASNEHPPLDEKYLLCDEHIESLESFELDGSALQCIEEMNHPTEDRQLSDTAVRELTVLAAQEAALMRQLALVIRRKTLTLAEQRVRLVEDTQKKILG